MTGFGGDADLLSAAAQSPGAAVILSAGVAVIAFAGNIFVDATGGGVTGFRGAVVTIVTVHRVAVGTFAIFTDAEEDTFVFDGADVCVVDEGATLTGHAEVGGAVVVITAGQLVAAACAFLADVILSAGVTVITFRVISCCLKAARALVQVAERDLTGLL